MNPLQWIETFAKFAGVGTTLVESFVAKHPELIDEHHPAAPPEAPTGDVDPDVEARIRAGKV